MPKSICPCPQCAHQDADPRGKRKELVHEFFEYCVRCRWTAFLGWQVELPVANRADVSESSHYSPDAGVVVTEFTTIPIDHVKARRGG